MESKYGYSETKWVRCGSNPESGFYSHSFPVPLIWKKFINKLCREYSRSKNELNVPVEKGDAVSTASGEEAEEADVDYRKKIKYGNRFQVKYIPIHIKVKVH